MDGYSGGVEVDDPNCADSICGVDRQFVVEVATAGGIGKYLNDYVRRPSGAESIKNPRPLVRDVQQVGLAGV